MIRFLNFINLLFIYYLGREDGDNDNDNNNDQESVGEGGRGKNLFLVRF